MPTTAKTIVVTDADSLRLREMIASLRPVGNPYRGYLRRLDQELRAARVVPAGEVDDDVVTMNSHVRVLDFDTSTPEHLTLVYHGDDDIFSARLSVLTPLGTELLGQRAGDEIQWEVPGGVRRLRVERILYQPEAHRHFHL